VGWAWWFSVWFKIDACVGGFVFSDVFSFSVRIGGCIGLVFLVVLLFEWCSFSVFLLFVCMCWWFCFGWFDFAGGSLSFSVRIVCFWSWGTIQMGRRIFLDASADFQHALLFVPLRAIFVPCGGPHSSSRNNA
jgi:hypothetical protein